VIQFVIVDYYNLFLVVARVAVKHFNQESTVTVSHPMKIYISSYVFWSTTIGALVVSTNNAAHALENDGECTIDPETGTCQAETKPQIPDQAALVDDYPSCEAWAEEGECDVNIKYVNNYSIVSSLLSRCIIKKERH